MSSRSKDRMCRGRDIHHKAKHHKVKQRVTDLDLPFCPSCASAFTHIRRVMPAEEFLLTRLKKKAQNKKGIIGGKTRTLRENMGAIDEIRLLSFLFLVLCHPSCVQSQSCTKCTDCDRDLTVRGGLKGQQCYVYSCPDGKYPIVFKMRAHSTDDSKFLFNLYESCDTAHANVEENFLKEGGLERENI